MHKKLQKCMRLVPIWKKMGKNEEEIKTLLVEQGLSSEEVKKIINHYTERLLEAKEKIKADRVRYANELDEDKLKELIQLVKHWYLYRNPNKYQISKKLKRMGVDEKYHEDVRVAALESASKASNRKGNWKIALGMILTIVGINLMILGFDTTGEGQNIARLRVVPFVFGLVLIVWGFAQKNTM